MIYPIIQYSHIINKNTAEFTLKDFAGYMKWWMKQPVREDIVRKQQSYKAAMQSRVPVDIEQIDDGVAQELSEEVVSDEIVADMGLTQQDIDALAWGIRQLLEMFDFSELPEHEQSLTKLGNELEPLVIKGE